MGAAETIDPTEHRFKQRSAAIDRGGEALEVELPRIANGDCSRGERWAVIVEGYQACQAVRRDYKTDVAAARMKGAREAVAAFEKEHAVRLWLGGIGIKLIIGLILLGLLMLLIKFRREVFGFLAGVRRG